MFVLALCVFVLTALPAADFAPLPAPAPLPPAPLLSAPDTRTQISPATALPYSAVCRLYITYSSGANAIASGFLIGNRWVLTAAHNLYNPLSGVGATAVVVYPGEDGVTTPFGSAILLQSFMADAWRNYADYDYDYALMQIDQPLGQAAGRLYFNPATDAYFNSLPPVEGAGYPTDLTALGTDQYTATGTAQGYTTRLFFDDHDSDAGEQGGPLFDATHTVIGVRSVDHLGLNLNQELRINTDVIHNLKTAIDDWFDKVGDNEIPSGATDINFLRGQWLSAWLGTPCVQWDEDWYQIDLPAGETHVQVRCTFTHANGNIDLELTDAQGNGFTPVAGSRIAATAADTEVIDCLVPAGGSYRIRVHGDNLENTYDLVWDRYNSPDLIFAGGSGLVLLAEGAPPASVPVTLNAQPSATVTVTITPDAQLSSAPATLTFTPANWDLPQNVTFGAIDDAVAEPTMAATLTFTTASADPFFNTAQTWTITAQITDNDHPGFTRVESGGATAVAEGGATDSYTLVLKSQPTADVTITPTPDGQLAVSPATLTFTSGTWNVPQTVTVTAVDDGAVEGPHTGTITHAVSSADAVYHNRSLAALSVAIADNDPGILVHPNSTGGVQKITEGSRSSYTVELTLPPTADVTVTVTPDPQLTANAATLTFTTLNWNVRQPVQLTAVNDTLHQGDRNVPVTHQAASADAQYNTAQTILSVLIRDNEGRMNHGKKTGCDLGFSAAAGPSSADLLPVFLCLILLVTLRRTTVREAA